MFYIIIITMIIILLYYYNNVATNSKILLFLADILFSHAAIAAAISAGAASIGYRGKLH